MRCWMSNFSEKVSLRGLVLFTYGSSHFNMLRTQPNNENSDIPIGFFVSINENFKRQGSMFSFVHLVSIR